MDFIRSGADPAERMIRHLVECEHDYINCDHPEFIGGRGAIRAVMQERSVRAAQSRSAAAARAGGDGGSGSGDACAVRDLSTPKNARELSGGAQSNAGSDTAASGLTRTSAGHVGVVFFARSVPIACSRGLELRLLAVATSAGCLTHAQLSPPP